MNNKITTLAVLIMGGTLGGCVSQQQLDSMQARLMRQEQQIQQFSTQLSGVQPAQADTWAQVQSLRQEMGAVRGQIDDFNNATASMGGLSGLAGRMDRQQAALRTLETQFGLDLKLDEPVAAPGLPGTAAAGVPGVPGAQVPGAAGASQAGLAGGTLPGSVTLPPPHSTAPVGTQAMQRPQTPPQQTAPQQNSDVQKDTATVLYDAGIKSFNSRNYKEAFKSFRDFTDTYPKHKLVSNAWFWRGESNFAQSNFPAAALDYEQVISQYPTSPKVASAYLKQGLSFYRTGKKDAARFRLEELIKKFPKSPEATRAKQVIKENTK